MNLALEAPSPKQVQFYRASTKHVGFGGARGGGKSHAVRTKAVLLAFEYPGIRMLIVRRTYPELVNNHINQLRVLLRDVARYNDKDKVFKFLGGSTINFMYCAKDSDLDRLQGVEYDVIFLDEATQLSEHQMRVIGACVRGAKLDRDGAIEEIVADASGEALSRLTEAQMQELAQENPTLLKKIANFMKKWISNLKRQIELAFKGTEAKTEVARQMQDALDEMAEMWNGLLVEASRTANQTAQKAKPAAAQTAQTTAQTAQTKTEAAQESEKLFIPYAHIDERDIFSVKEEQTELFCSEVEEARFAYAAAAEVLLDDLNVSVPGQKIYIRDSQGALSVTGQNRTTSDLLARMKDETGWTWDELRQTLTAFADMGDAEKGYPLVKNTIRNRRMEVYLHEMLTRGYKTLDGAQLAPWREYVEAMAEYQGSKGAGLDVQSPKGAIPFEEYAFADMFADNGDVKYSTRDGIEFAEDKYYSRLIDRIDTAKEGGYIRVGSIRADSILNRVGLPATNLYFDVSKIRNQLEKHEDHLDEGVLKHIPEVLRNPVVVAEANVSNTVNVFGDLAVGDSPIMIGIMVTRDRSGRNIINKIRTVHARRDFMSRINDSNVLYLDPNKNRTREWFQARGNVVPLGGTRFGFIRRIAQPDDSVKRSLRAPVEFV